MTENSILDIGPPPDVVWLFRQPILAEWRDRGNVELNELIAHVVNRGSNLAQPMPLGTRKALP